MRLFIDCEFNSFNGQLISIALVDEKNKDFYAVLPIHEELHPWVKENVMPVLICNEESVGSAFGRLAKFLSVYDDIEIVADHPADIKYFCEFIEVGDGDWMKLPRPLKFSIIKVDYNSNIPHNALADAKAIREKVLFGGQK